jgi:hypothetical protein
LSGFIGSKSKNGGEAGKFGGTTMVVGKDQIKTIRDQTEKGQKADAIIISKDELSRMKGTAIHISKDQ